LIKVAPLLNGWRTEGVALCGYLSVVQHFQWHAIGYFFAVKSRSVQSAITW